MNDYYTILGVEANADETAVRASYAKLLQGPLPPCVSMAAIDEAFTILKDPVKRKAYDRARAAPPQPSPVAQAPEPATAPPSPPPLYQQPQPTRTPQFPPGTRPGGNQHLYGKSNAAPAWEKGIRYAVNLLGLGTILTTAVGWILSAASLVVLALIAGVVYWMWPKATPIYHPSPVRVPSVSQLPRLESAPVRMRSPTVQQKSGLPLTSPYANVQRLMQEAFAENPEMRNEAVAQIQKFSNPRLGDHEQSDSLVRDARAALARNDDRTAFDHFNRALHIDATNIDAWVGSIRVATKVGQLKSAEQTAIQGLTFNTHSEKLWIALSELYEKAGRHDLAITAMENSVLLSSDPAAAVAKLRSNSDELGRYGLKEVAQATLEKSAIKSL
jgi:tetratricopeptide (TPR) repeat protein